MKNLFTNMQLQYVHKFFKILQILLMYNKIFKKLLYIEKFINLVVISSKYKKN